MIEDAYPSRPDSCKRGNHTRSQVHPDWCRYLEIRDLTRSLEHKYRLKRSEALHSRPEGEVAEWSNAAVLKTALPTGNGGSNPSLSADQKPLAVRLRLFLF